MAFGSSPSTRQELKRHIEQQFDVDRLIDNFERMVREQMEHADDPRDLDTVHLASEFCESLTDGIYSYMLGHAQDLIQEELDRQQDEQQQEQSGSTRSR